MRILMTAYACSPYAGSELGNGFNWAYHTALRGHEVYCLTRTKTKKDIERYIAENPQANLHFVYVELPDWVERLYGSSVGMYIHYIVWQYRAYKAAIRIDAEKPLDILHHVTWGSLQLGSFLWKLKKPFVFGPVGGGQKAPNKFKKYFYQGWKPEVLRNRIQNLFHFLKLSQKAVKGASTVLVSNQETYDLARKLGAKNIEYAVDTGLPDTFFPSTFPERPADDTLKILWVGRIFPRKGLPLVLEALSEVPEDIPFTLTVLGDGPMATMIPPLIKDFGLEKKVTLKGQVSWEEVKQAYLTHDVFMFCSLRDSFASQFLEAMAFGLPILTLNLHGVGKLVSEKAAVKVSVDTPEKTIKELVDGIIWLYRYPIDRIQMGKNGYQFAKTQSWMEKTAEAERIYRQFVAPDVLHEMELTDTINKDY